MSVVDRLQAAGFEVYTRQQWKSPREADGSYARRKRTHGITGPVPYHYLHVTVTPDTDTVQQGAAGARQIEKYGYSTPPMVSYQMLVTNEGKIFEGQNYGVKGTHTVNDKRISGFPEDLNRQGYAVALMQNVNDAVTDAQVRAVAACFAAAELEGYVKRGAPIFPHRKFAAKSCPGDKAVARLAQIERLKNEMVRQGLKEEDMPLSPQDLKKVEEVVKAAIDGNQLDVGKPKPRSEDKVAQLLLQRTWDTHKAIENLSAAVEQLTAHIKEGSSK